MGTDVHGGFIKRNKITEVKTPIKTKWKFDRNYTLFAILAGVRNGYGFAGCYRHEPLTPVAEGRGLPDWLETEEGGEYTPELYNPWYGSRWGEKDEKEFGCWLGDHSRTHMTLDEILSWEGWNNYIVQGGVLTKEHYVETICQGTNPEQWCGGVSGGDTNVVEEQVMNSLLLAGGSAKNITHIQCKWKSDQTLREDYSWFLGEIERIKREYPTEEGEEIYLVVGFDS